MPWFAIRHKPTGRLLPECVYHAAKNSELDDDYPPRLFKRSGYAQRSLNLWLQGPTFKNGQPARVAEDMEVVPVQVIVDYG